MKRNSHNHFRKSKVKNVENADVANEQEINKNKLQKKKSSIKKEISNLSSNSLNHSRNKNNNYLNKPQPNLIKKKSVENQFLVNHLIFKNNHLRLSMNDLFNKSSKNAIASNNNDKLKLTSINHNYNLNRSSLSGEKKEKLNFLALPRASKKDLNINKIRCSYENILTRNNLKERKSANLQKKFELRKSMNLSLGPTFLMARRSKQVDQNLKDMRKSITNSKINILDLYDNKDKIKIMNINQNIQNELGSKQLKKRIKKMKKVIRQNSIVEFQKLYNIKNSIEEQSSIKVEQSEKSELKISEKESDCNQNYYQINNFKLIEEENAIDKIKNKDKFRFIQRTKELYDSFDDEEFEDQTETDYYISPNNYFIKIFDLIVFMAAMIYFVYVPFLFSRNLIISPEKTNIMLILIDIIYIFDIILNFFRAYQNFDETLVRNRKYIFLHYLKSWFFIDFIQCIPYFSLFKYLDNLHMKNENRYVNSLGYEYNKFSRLLYLIILVKIIKLYKILNENITLSQIGEIISRIEIIDDYGSFLFSLFYSFSAINLCACIFIFIGRNSYPGWLVKINMHDESNKDIYITSVYYILVTITTVGYGDITGSSYPDIIYQMFLLIIGTFAYSFVISYFSNYIVKINQKSITFQKNVSILEEIRLHHPDLKDSIYQEILKNLHIEQLYEKNDKNILFDCLPLTLKNKLIMEMYKDLINKFIFFKDNQHSDFIVKVVTSLKPLLAFKDDVLIEQGDYVKEIFFVKKGVLALNITIDKGNAKDSINKYLDIDERGKINIFYLSSKINGSSPREGEKNLYERVNTFLLNGKKNEVKKIKKGLNISEIKIIEVHKNEHFGDALMFLNEKSPLVLKVKTKVSELLVLRKMEAVEIYSIYPNIWMRINKKSIFNMEQIKKRIKKELYIISKKYSSMHENMLKKSKTIKKYLNYISPQSKGEKSKIDKNKSKKENKSEKSDKEKNKNDEESFPKEKGSKSNKESNRKSEAEKEKEENSENKNKDIIKKGSNKQTPGLLDNKSNNSKNRSKSKSKLKSKDSNTVSSEISEASKKKNEENENIKTNELIFNSHTLNANKSDMQKSLNTSKKITKDEDQKENNKVNSSFRLKLEKVNDTSNRVQNDSSRSSEYDNNSKISDIKKESEKFAFNSFSNLSKTNEKSFQINSIYENLNNISNNKYGSNLGLQLKIKNVLRGESNSLNHSHSKKQNVKSHIGGNKILSKFNTVKSLSNFTDIEEEKKSANSLDESKLKSYRSSNINKESRIESIKTFKNEEELAENLTLKKYGSCNKFKSSKMNMKNGTISPKKMRYNKSPRKKGIEHFGMSKKLNIINQNIKNTNKNINNPEEFYMDFFNDILKKNTAEIKKEKVINKSGTYKNTYNFMSEVKGKKIQAK